VGIYQTPLGTKMTPPNIVLIVMDTVRADHLSCYGHRNQTTPNIDRLASEGVIFENNYTVAPWTPPSHASIFTGKYPTYHRTLGKNLTLLGDNTTLAESLRDKGYLTVGFTGCSLLSPSEGFSQGFQRYDGMYSFNKAEILKHYKDAFRTALKGPDKYAYRTNETVKQLRPTLSKHQPFFLFINYFTCHTPYNPPKPYQNTFTDAFSEPSVYLVEYVAEKLGINTIGAKTDTVNLEHVMHVATREGHFPYMKGVIPMSPADWDVVKALYDGGLHYLDEIIGELVDFIRTNFAETLFIITADHGESFGEHGLANHPYCVYDNILRVPLIMAYPERLPTKTRVHDLTATIDIFPTVLDVLADNATFDGQGISLLPEGEPRSRDFICSEYGGDVTLWRKFYKVDDAVKVNKGSKCIRTNEFKYILNVDKPDELYNVRDDPREARNILPDNRDLGARLRTVLAETVDVSYYGPSDLPSEDSVLERLKHLGYM
jgi:arylsulfatase A-like enzyme